MEVFLVTNTDSSVEEDEILDLVKRAVCDASEQYDNLALVTGGDAQFRSVLDWAAATCRANHKLNRKVLLELGDQGVVARLLLQAASRELTGDSDFVVSDLLEVEGKIKKARKEGKWPEKGDGVVGEAVGRYKDFVKECSLVDRWEVVKEALTSVEGEKMGLVVLGLGEEMDLVDSLSGGIVRPVSLQHGSVVVGEKTGLAGLACSEGVRREMGCEQMGTMGSFLRLLVCSRDELSLARAVTSSGLLTNHQFTLVRRETEAGTMKMSMYQTIVSFVRLVGLGGKSYQPGEQNSLHDMMDKLVEFNRLMEKLQSKLEETTGAVPAVMAVVTTLKSWLVKQGVVVEGDMVDKIEKLVGEVERRLASLQATPARGLMGRPAMKMLIGLVDLLASVGQDQSKEMMGKTPARQAKLVQSFKTPQPDVVLDPEDEMDCLVQDRNLSDRLGVQEGGVSTPVARPAFPRFKTLNDFTEGSPALIRSGERGGTVTGGRTLMARAGESLGESPCISVENTRRILQEVKEKDELEEAEKVERAKDNIKKTKRCLAKEVDSLVRDKMGLKRKKDENEGNNSKENKVKQPAKKKKFSTPKGQKKMTSFFKK